MGFFSFFGIAPRSSVKLYFLEEGVRMLRVEEFICPHKRDKVFRVGEIDDVMRIPRQHVHRLNLLSADLKLQHFIRPDLSLLNQAVTGDNDKEFPLAVVPVLALRDPGLRDIDAELSVIQGLQGRQASLPQDRR